MNIKIRPELKLIADSLRILERDGIIRTKNLVGDLGEYYCQEIFDVKLNSKVNETGFDAKDNKGEKVEIKTRRIPENVAKVSFKSFDFDYCFYVELNEYYEPIIILKLGRSVILKNLEKGYNRLSVGTIKSINTKTQMYP